MRKYLAYQPDPRDQVFRPGTGFSEGCERDSSDDAATDTKRDAQMRMESCPLAIFGLADRFRRKIYIGVLHDQCPAGAKLGNEPSKPRRERPERRGLDTLDGCRGHNDEGAVVLKFCKRTAIE